MKISDYSVNMSSKSVYSQTSNESFYLSMWGSKGRTLALDNPNEPSSKNSNSTDYFNQSEGSLKDLYEKEVKGTSSISKNINRSYSTLDELRYKFVDHFLRWLFGEDYESKDIYQLLHGDQSSNQGFGGEMSHYSFFSESEETTFNSTGTVINSEGKEISFDMSFTLSRSFSTSIQMNRSFGSKLIDPLVVNVESPITDIGNQSFYFDLNCDGIEEEVTSLGKGSAFLALDKNGDDEINDGSELFGALSGDGFSDLSLYDEDSNDWIDENDSVFDKLKIFSVDASGKKTLLTLKESGIGAICLKNINTNYHFTSDTAKNASAFLRKSGIFLYENGSVGTLGQVDLAVKETESMEKVV